MPNLNKLQAFDDRVDSDFLVPQTKRTVNPRGGQNAKGQIILEYVLLMIAVVSITIVIVQTMISRDPGNPGFVIEAWNEIIKAIGADPADDISP